MEIESRSEAQLEEARDRCDVTVVTVGIAVAEAHDAMTACVRGAASGTQIDTD